MWMPKPPQEISDEAKAELAERRQAAEQLIADEAEGLPALEAVAFLASAEQAAADLIGPAVDRARADRFTWREISEAEGEGDSREAADRSYIRHSRRS